MGRPAAMSSGAYLCRMRIRGWMVAASALFCGAAQAQTPQNTTAAQAQPKDGTRERSTTSNNSAVRAVEEKNTAAQTNDEATRFPQVPGRPATARKDWKKGDPRGKPQDPAQARRGRRLRRLQHQDRNR